MSASDSDTWQGAFQEKHSRPEMRKVEEQNLAGVSKTKLHMNGRSVMIRN